jgi:hypothetical protein
MGTGSCSTALNCWMHRAALRGYTGTMCMRMGMGTLERGEVWRCACKHEHEYGTSGSPSEASAVVERAGGGDIVPVGSANGARGWDAEEDGDVDVVGDADAGMSFISSALLLPPSSSFFLSIRLAD